LEKKKGEKAEGKNFLITKGMLLAARQKHLERVQKTRKRALGKRLGKKACFLLKTNSKCG